MVQSPLQGQWERREPFALQESMTPKSQLVEYRRNLRIDAVHRGVWSSTEAAAGDKTPPAWRLPSLYGAKSTFYLTIFKACSPEIKLSGLRYALIGAVHSPRPGEVLYLYLYGIVRTIFTVVSRQFWL